MTILTSTLRPGLLVSLKTSVSGNVRYTKNEIEADHTTGDGKRLARWETERVINDPAEHEEAVTARSKLRSLIRSVCVQSDFGMLCPQALENELVTAMADARAVADKFNASAKQTRIAVYMIVGKIAEDDVEAVRAINSEVRGLLAEMEVGLKNLDVEAVRKAASSAKNIGSMLTPDAAARIQTAVDAARAAARKIVAAGEVGAVEVDRLTMLAIMTARTAFLDLDPAGEVAAPEASGRALDLAPIAPVAQPVVVANQLEL